MRVNCCIKLMRMSVPTIAIMRLVSVIGMGNKVSMDLTCGSKSVVIPQPHIG